MRESCHTHEQFEMYYLYILVDTYAKTLDRLLCSLAVLEIVGVCAGC